MRKKLADLMIGSILLIIGVLFLLNNLDVVYLESSLFWAPFFVVLSLLFFIYYWRERGSWWAVIPGVITLTLALIIFFDYLRLFSGGVLGSIFLWGTAVAFLLVYLVDRKNWWALIPFWVTLILGATAIVETSHRFASGLGGAIFLAGMGLGFLGVYILNRSNRWALLPCLVFIALSGVVLVEVARLLPGMIGGTVFLWGAGLGFLVLYWLDRKNWWAVIPGGTLLVLGVYPLMAGFHWQGDGFKGFWFFFGMGLVFGSLYLIRDEENRLQWAKVPFIVLTAFSVFILLVSYYDLLGKVVFPVVLLLLGVYMIYKSAVRKREVEREE